MCEYSSVKYTTSKSYSSMVNYFVLCLTMPYQRISVADKRRLIKAYNRNEDYFALAKQLNIKRGRAYAIICRSMGRDGITERAIGAH